YEDTEGRRQKYKLRGSHYCWLTPCMTCSTLSRDKFLIRRAGEGPAAPGHQYTMALCIAPAQTFSEYPALSQPIPNSVLSGEELWTSGRSSKEPLSTAGLRAEPGRRVQESAPDGWMSHFCCDFSSGSWRGA